MTQSYTRYKVYYQNGSIIFVGKQVLLCTYKVIIGSQGGKVSTHEKQYQATYYLPPFVFYKLSMHSLTTVCRGHPSSGYPRDNFSVVLVQPVVFGPVPKRIMHQNNDVNRSVQNFIQTCISIHPVRRGQYIVTITGIKKAIPVVNTTFFKVEVMVTLL